MDLQSRIKAAVRDVPDFPKPGIMFRDITPVLADVSLCREITEHLFRSFANEKVDAILAVESRGFLFGMLLAQKFGVPFIPVRKKGKLPYQTITYEYDLEYGSAVMEMHIDAIKQGSSVLIHDDLLATGGTAAAAAGLVKMQQGHVAGFAFLIELEALKGREKIAAHSDNIITLVNY